MNWKLFVAFGKAFLRWMELGLALVSILIAIWALMLARKQDDNIKEVSSRLSTKYVGPFPEFLDLITRDLHTATKSIKIACDVPAYGMFSEWVKFKAYEREISDQSEKPGVEVEMIAYGIDLQAQATRDQFPGDYFKIVSAPENPDTRFRNFLRLVDVPSIKTVDEFIRILEEQQDREVNGNFRHVRGMHLSSEIPAYFWIVDDRVAVFAIPAKGQERTEEIGFETRDQRLIQALSEMFKTYKGAALNNLETRTLH